MFLYNRDITINHCNLLYLLFFIGGNKLNTNYINVVENIKSQIRNSQHRAILNANKELVILYWNIGKIIDEHSEWGNKFLNNLASEIRLEFPTSKGFSARNLWNMIKFYRVFRSFEIVQTLAAQIPWSHNVEILRVDSPDKRIWYIERTIENGWSKNVLVHQINTKLYERQNNNDKISNFSKLLSSPQKEMAIETHKDP